MSLLTDTQGIAGLATGLIGAVQQFKGASSQFAAARDILKETQAEMSLILQEGDVLARNARQRAYAALDDQATNAARAEAAERAIHEQGDRLQSELVARTAGSGIALTGSPLLVLADVALQTERAAANARLTAAYGNRRFQFEAEREMQSARDIEAGAQAQATGLGQFRASQAGAIQEGARFGQIRAITGLSELFTNKGTQELVRGLFPEQPTTATRTSTYRGVPTNMGYDY